MKIAISGKGGVGKTTITAGLARSLARHGHEVVALDLDPSPNLLSALGSDNLTSPPRPLFEMNDLIEEKTGARPGEGYGLIFKLNPDVSDILGRFGLKCRDGVTLLVMGEITKGGGGCFCPENALAKRLIDYLLWKEQYLLLDMEAGLEHLGRATTEKVDALLVVVEPNLRSLETAQRIKALASDLKIKNVLGVLNKVRTEEEEEKIASLLEENGIPLLQSIPWEEAVLRADLKGIPVFDLPEASIIRERIEDLANALESLG